MNRDKLSKADSLEFDVRRTVVLGQYMAAWGMPEYRTISKHEQSGQSVEVYSFPPLGNDEVHRLSTVGVSQ